MKPESKWNIKKEDLLQRPRYLVFKEECRKLVEVYAEIRKLQRKYGDPERGQLSKFVIPDVRYEMGLEGVHVLNFPQCECDLSISISVQRFNNGWIRPVQVDPKRILNDSLHLPQLTMLCLVIDALEDFELIMLTQADHLGIGKYQPVKELAQAMLRARHTPVESIPPEPQPGEVYKNKDEDADSRYKIIGEPGDDYVQAHSGHTLWDASSGVPKELVEIKDFMQVDGSPRSWQACIMSGHTVKVTDPAEIKKLRSRLISQCRSSVSRELRDSRKYTPKNIVLMKAYVEKYKAYLDSIIKMPISAGSGSPQPEVDKNHEEAQNEKETVVSGL
jgi:hypothetical protein